MPDKAKAKQFNFPLMVQDWHGYVSSVDKTNISEHLLVSGSQNVYKKLSGTIAVREGEKRLGDANETLSSCSSEFVWNTSWGATYTLVVSNSNLYVVIDDVWYSLLSGLTETRYVFDNWWDNTEKKDRVLFVNGNDYIQHWSGGYATVFTSTATTITKSGSTSWQQAGFATNTAGEKKVMIGGTEYTYTGGESTTTLTGVTPSPAGVTVGATALQSVITETDTPAADFSNDFIKIINNQVYVGSYTSRLCYISDDTDFTNYVVPTPRAPGDPELLTLDGTLNGIGVKSGSACISFGTSSWAVVTFENITVGSDLTQQTKVDVKPVAVLQAAYAHEFIDSTGDNLVYLAKDQQVRMFGNFNNAFVPVYPSISQEVATELQGINFTGGGLRIIGEFTYVTAPATGVCYLYQVRQKVDPNGQVVAERLWHSPFIWNVTRVDTANGLIIGFSNANPQIYQLWDTDQYYDDSPSDEHLPYTSVAAFGYRTLNRRQGLQSFDKLYTEGYLTEGTPLYATVNYNYQGSLNAVNVIINSQSQPATLFGSSNPVSLGDSSLGDESLGDSGLTGQDDLPKFKVINSMSIINCFEYQPIFYSTDVNARWELLATCTNAEVEVEQDATFIIAKPRPVLSSFLLQEDGDYLLLQTGYKIIL